MRNYQPTNADIAVALDALEVWSNEAKEPRNKRGPKTTIIRFLGTKKICDTAKAAYIAQLENFIAHDQVPLSMPHVTDGRDCNYLARKKEHLFPASPHLLDIRSNWRHLKDGWYANALMSAEEFFGRLRTYADACNLRIGTDWDFEPLDATDAMRDARKRALLNPQTPADALADLDAMG